MSNLIINARFLTQRMTGVQRVAIELSKGIKKKYKNVTFVAPPNIIQEKLAAELEVEIIGKLRGHLWEQFELPKYLKKQNNPLLFNFANTAPFLYSNQIVTIHDAAFLVHPEWFSKKFSLYYRWLIPLIVKKSKKVITVSEFSKKELLKHLNIEKSKIEVITNGLSTNFSISPKIKNELRFAQYGKYLLTVSSIDPRKNLKRTIFAFNKLNDKDIKLVIVGASNKVFKDLDLNQLVGENQNIIIYGYASDDELNALYSEAFGFVFPSLYEGFGLPPLEAMARSCPVLVSDRASLPEVCGEAALYCDPYNVNDITDKMNLLVSSHELREELIEKGIQQSGKFNWVSSVNKYIDLITEANKL